MLVLFPIGDRAWSIVASLYQFLCVFKRAQRLVLAKVGIDELFYPKMLLKSLYYNTYVIVDGYQPYLVSSVEYQLTISLVNCLR